MSCASNIELAFGQQLPRKLEGRVLPAAIAQGQLVFVIKDALNAGIPCAQWALHGNPAGAPGGHFLPHGEGAEPACRIELLAEDCIGFAAGVLNIQEAFMRGRIKLSGDLQCAMALGALFA